jgi:hypothetical protein
MIFEGMQDHTADRSSRSKGSVSRGSKRRTAISERSMSSSPTIRRRARSSGLAGIRISRQDAVEVFFATLEQDPLEKSRRAFVRVRIDLPRQSALSRRPPQEDAARDKRNDPDAYEHIWLGGYDLGGHGRVYSKFTNKSTPREHRRVDRGRSAAELLVGMDFNVNPMTP